MRIMSTIVARAHDNILRLPDVRRRCGNLHRATIYRKMEAGTFPQTVRLGERCVGWYEADINAWVADPR
jgi:prophage regulatory protein